MVMSAVLATIFIVDSSHVGFVIGGHLGSHVSSDGGHLGLNPSAILDPNSRLLGDWLHESLIPRQLILPSNLESIFSELFLKYFGLILDMLNSILVRRKLGPIYKERWNQSIKFF